ncbi:MAG: DUF1446 domain-containing protein [Schaedlerella sp.]|uniref:acyclic terpene utilization AtuA family protein n=1 Tax=Schaedlerella sp. TaxID=2676057 RepID=UPI002602CCE7|nr:acyclic terpene utilization AtuA family protein [uncultured Schaedlerella sp.]
MKTIRIGSGAGYAGDRIEPAVELMEKGNLDYIIFECLAERTVALGQKDKQSNPELGYNQRLKERMVKILPLAQKNHIRVVTNMGAANPKAAAEEICGLARELGVGGLRIACVTGDDIGDRLNRYAEHDILENGKKLKDIQDSLISANAYMGAEGIIEALARDADIVVTGRVSDPALTIGPLVHEFGWTLEECPDQMGQAVLAGHLLECAGQVTGGYYADPGYKEVPDLDRLGFPLLEVSEDGSFIVTKVEGSGGLVCVDTCKEQTIYEIHNPKAYMTPDAIADFSQVRYEQAGNNRVRAAGAATHGKPENLKVTIGYQDCFIGEGEISYGGKNCLERAKMAGKIVESRFQQMGLAIEELRIDYIGYNSLYLSAISDQLTQSEPAEVRLHVSARTQDAQTACAVADEVETLYTNGPAGGGGARKYVEEVFSVCSIFIPREDVHAEVTYMVTEGGSL